MPRAAVKKASSCSDCRPRSSEKARQWFTYRGAQRPQVVAYLRQAPTDAFSMMSGCVIIEIADSVTGI